jgi:hypothetical protein
LTNINAVDIKQRAYTYHHQNYMLQFEQSLKVQQVPSSEAEKIPKYAFNFCPFGLLRAKDVPSKPLIGIKE